MQVKLQHAADEPRDRTQQVAEPLAEADEDAATNEDAEALRTESMSFLVGVWHSCGGVPCVTSSRERGVGIPHLPRSPCERGQPNV